VDFESDVSNSFTPFMSVAINTLNEGLDIKNGLNLNCYWHPFGKWFMPLNGAFPDVHVIG
jgi:hypothetical protein